MLNYSMIHRYNSHNEESRFYEGQGDEYQYVINNYIFNLME